MENERWRTEDSWRWRAEDGWMGLYVEWRMEGGGRDCMENGRWRAEDGWVEVGRRGVWAAPLDGEIAHFVGLAKCSEIGIIVTNGFGPHMCRAWHGCRAPHPARALLAA